MDKPVALITGITGQDGSYLADLLLEKGYKVFGIKRRTSQNGLGCAAHLDGKAEIIEADVTDLPSLSHTVKLAKPHEFYNLAAQSHVGTSFSQPQATFEINAAGVLNCLEAIRSSGLHTRFLQASTSELFGGLSEAPSNEDTPFHPRSPYGVSKLAGHWFTVNYRESYRMFACCSISFNHEAPRRGPNFVTRKITQGIARIKAGKQKTLSLGNMSARRDWGHARDYVDAMWRMLQQGRPDDFVLGTGETHSVQEFCDLAFKIAGLDPQQHVIIDPLLFRPAEVNVLVADASKARTLLDWQPKTRFDKLVQEMVKHDLALEGQS